MKCLYCDKKIIGDYKVCPVCYAGRISDRIKTFEERNKLPMITSSSKNKITEARLYRMWMLGRLYRAYKDGDDLAIEHYRLYKTFKKANFWIDYFNKFEREQFYGNDGR